MAREERWKISFKNIGEEQKRARDVLDDLLRCECGLSGRELDFIEDMDGKRNLTWTEKQIDWLDIIYERVC
jgi:hypothetical protein